jgi:archaeal type IV pilus assembly protein PilA
MILQCDFLCVKKMVLKTLDESAISESIGVIVLVAITMVLAAALAAYMFNMTSSVPTSYNILLTVEQPNTTYLTVMYRGGSDQALLNSLTISWPDGMQQVIPHPRVGDIYGPVPIPADNRRIIVVGNFTNNYKEQILLNSKF